MDSTIGMLGLETENINAKMFMTGLCKGQWYSEWIYEVIVSPKMPTKNYQDFYPGSLLEGRAEILVVDFWLAFWEKRWPRKFILNLTDL